MYCAARHFHDSAEGRELNLYIDYKHLTFSLSLSSDKYSSRESRQMDYISQFTSYIQHISEVTDVVANVSSHISPLNIFQQIDILKLDQLQKTLIFSTGYLPETLNYVLGK